MKKMKNKGYAKGGMYGETATEKQMKMKKKGYAAGGKLPMVKGPDGKMVPEFAADGKGKMAKGGTIKKMKKGMKVKGYKAGGLKDVPEGNKGLGKLPQKARNNMGFKAKGGTIKKMAEGKEVDPRSMKPKKRPQSMTKKQQRIAGARGAASQYDTGTRDTPASEPVLRQKAKDTAKRQLDSLMGGGAKKALGMKAGGMMKTKGGTIRKMKGGKMVTKGGTKGGAKGGKAKVRGAGIAQRGVRPAKMR